MSGQKKSKLVRKKLSVVLSPRLGKEKLKQLREKTRRDGYHRVASQKAKKERGNFFIIIFFFINKK